MVEEVDAPTLKKWLEAGSPAVTIVDVREQTEYAQEHIQGALLRPLSAFDPGAVPACGADSVVVLHCRHGRRSFDAGCRLLAAGHERAVHLRGGLEAWKSAGLPVEH